MDRRENRVFLLRAVSFLCGFCLLFAAFSRLLNDKTGRKYDEPFFTSGDRYEVLFFGSSHMYNGVLPLQLYRQTGVLSYNLGMTNEYPATTYWRLADALQRQQPKVVVVDVYRALAADKIGRAESDMAFLHNSLDSMPLSLTKVRALADLLDARPWDLDAMFDYLFPLAQFHSRYNSLTEDDFHPYLMETRGAMPLRQLHSGTPLPLDETPAERTAPLGSEAGEAALRRILELCADRELPVVLLALPYQAPAEELARLNSLAGLTAEYPGAVWLNLLYEDLIDPAADFADAEGHLNTAGAAKVTAWLGWWLTEHYALTDRRGDPACAGWEQSLANVRAQQMNHLAGADLNTALMLLVGQEVEFSVELTAEAAQDPVTASLLTALGVPLPQPGQALRWRSAGAPEVYGGAGCVIAFDPDTGAELARSAAG